MKMWDHCRMEWVIQWQQTQTRLRYSAAFALVISYEVSQVRASLQFLSTYMILQSYSSVIFCFLLPLLQLKHNSGTTVHISSSLPEKLWHCLLIAEMLVETQGTKLLMVCTPNSTILCWHLGSEEHNMFWGRKMSFFLIWLASVPGYTCKFPIPLHFAVSIHVH